jgi:hypothetical protein
MSRPQSTEMQRDSRGGGIKDISLSYGPQVCTMGAQFLVLQYFNYVVAFYVT